VGGEDEGDTGRRRAHVPPQRVRDLSARLDEIEVEDADEGKKHHRMIETNADQYRELISWWAIGIDVEYQDILKELNDL